MRTSSSSASLAGILVLGALLAPGPRAHAQTDPLPSWNDGPAKQAILSFVKGTTDPASPKFVPPAERIATFDQDGTLWVSHPMYTQVMYCLERVAVLVKAKPEMATAEPFKTVLQVLKGDREALAKLTMKDSEAILTATLTGMSVDEFSAEVKKLREDHPGQGLALEAPLHRARLPPHAGGPEVPARASGYKTYIVTGGGQDFVRYTWRQPTAFLPSRWSEPPGERSTATTRTASPS